MIRDYSEEVYNKLNKQIDDINNETTNPIIECVEDFFLRVGKWINLVDLNRTKNYQKRMLDMNNTTKSDLEKIFKKVRNIDKCTAIDIGDINERMKVYNKKIQDLSKIIRPGLKIDSAGTIKAFCKKYNTKLEEADKIIYEEHLKVVKKTEKKVLLKSTKGIISGVVSSAVEIYSLPAKWIYTLATKGKGKLSKEIIKSSLSLVNGVFSVGSNGVSIALSGMALLCGKNVIYSEIILEDAEAYAGVSCFSETVEAMEKTGEKGTITSEALKIDNILEDINTVDDLFSDAKSLVTERKGIFPDTSSLKHKELEKADVLDDAKKDYLYIKKLYNKFEKNKILASRIEKIYGYAETFFDINEKGKIKDLLENKLLEESKIFKDIEKLTKPDETFKTDFIQKNKS